MLASSLASAASASDTALAKVTEDKLFLDLSVVTALSLKHCVLMVMIVILLSCLVALAHSVCLILVLYLTSCVTLKRISRVFSSPFFSLGELSTLMTSITWLLVLHSQVVLDFAV